MCFEREGLRVEQNVGKTRGLADTIQRNFTVDDSHFRSLPYHDFSETFISR